MPVFTERRRLIATVVSALVLLAAPVASSGRASSGAHAEAAAKRTYAQFTGARQYRPSTLYFGAHEVITGVTWSKWGMKLAKGTGTYQVNDCTPDCADGMITPTPSTIFLTGRERCGKRFVFRHLKVLFSGRRRTSPALCT
jgi:hypothetical protein